MSPSGCDRGCGDPRSAYDMHLGFLGLSFVPRRQCCRREGDVMRLRIKFPLLLVHLVDNDVEEDKGSFGRHFSGVVDLIVSSSYEGSLQRRLPANG